VTTTGITPLPKKIDAIRRLKPQKTKKELRRFIQMVNFYHDMWIRRSEILAPLTAIMSNKAAWQWTYVKHDAFDTILRIMGSKHTRMQVTFRWARFYMNTINQLLSTAKTCNYQTRAISSYSSHFKRIRKYSTWS
jgi:hypothetical protein